MNRYPRAWKFISDHPWALLPATLDMIVELMEMRAAGQVFTDEEIQARIGAARPRPAPQSTAGAIAVVAIHGVIAPRVNMMTEISGGTSADQLSMLMQRAVADPEISAIVLDVDSPGGSVFGCEELAATIRSLRGQKPIVAVANHLMASAAYWLASQADEVIASPSSQMGSIGVIAVHHDVSAAEAKEGVKTTLVTAGKYKGEGHPTQPLGEDARAAMQGLADGYYDAFVRDVARGRGVKPGAVREGFGEGRIVAAADAVRFGMADAVGTMSDVLGRLASGAKRVSVARAEGGPIVADPLAETAPATAVEREVAELREALAARA